ncbi:MAG: Holliday junction branch migration protein RuvA [candidate division Zixibacteria bacterium]|nr:Holliday junction branch migration protein RuvA [candidate division Zixibacteria bacterium]
MISYLEGRLIEKNPTLAVVDINGVGYGVNIPLSTYERLNNIGERVKLLTYQYVREDTLQLYGFLTPEEKETFKLLLTVSGIGPKSALGVLSCISVEDFQRSILEEDIDVLTSISGIGNKTAQRLVVELKEKLGKMDLKGLKVGERIDTEEDEAISALVSLGYTRLEAKRAILQAMGKSKGKLSVEELVKKALSCSK